MANKCINDNSSEIIIWENDNYTNFYKDRITIVLEFLETLGIKESNYKLIFLEISNDKIINVPAFFVARIFFERYLLELNESDIARMNVHRDNYVTIIGIFFLMIAHKLTNDSSRKECLMINRDYYYYFNRFYKDFSIYYDLDEFNRLEHMVLQKIKWNIGMNDLNEKNNKTR